MIKTVAKEDTILQIAIYWIKFFKYRKMVKNISIKSRSYFFNDMIALKDFDEVNLKVDKKKKNTLAFATLVTSRLKKLMIMGIFIV